MTPMQSVVALTLTVLVVVHGQTSPCGDNQCPTYESQAFDGYELRTYTGENKWATTTSPAGRRSTRQMFMRLFKYIGGENDRSEKIDMTVPVLTKKDMNGGSSTMSFYLAIPSPPVPTNNEVVVEVKSNAQYYVRSFKQARWAFGRVYEREVAALKAAIGDPTLYDNSAYYQVGYTSPMHIGMRHYEVWVEKL